MYTRDFSPVWNRWVLLEDHITAKHLYSNTFKPVQCVPCRYSVSLQRSHRLCGLRILYKWVLIELSISIQVHVLYSTDLPKTGPPKHINSTGTPSHFIVQFSAQIASSYTHIYMHQNIYTYSADHLGSVASWMRKPWLSTEEILSSLAEIQRIKGSASRNEARLARLGPNKSIHDGIILDRTILIWSDFVDWIGIVRFTQTTLH